MCEFDHKAEHNKESAEEDSWESFGLHGDKPVNLKRNQLWILIRRTGAEAEALIPWPCDAKSWLIGKTLMLGRIEGKGRRKWQRMRWLYSITDSMDMSLSTLQEIVKDSGDLCAADHGVTKSWTWLVIEQKTASQRDDFSELRLLNFPYITNSYVPRIYTKTFLFKIYELHWAIFI